MNYYEHHLGDYLRDAGHLSMIEDGAYRRLIDTCYSTERPLPNDIKEVCKLARANTKPEKDAVRYVLSKFFKLTDAGYVQKRCQEEIERYRKKIEAASAAGKASAESRQRKATTVQQSFNDRSTDVDDPLSISRDENSTLQTPGPIHQAPLSESAAEEAIERRTRCADLAIPLRQAGVKVSTDHPTLVAWVKDGYTLQNCLSALAIARESKPDGDIPANYLDPIIREPRKPKLAFIQPPPNQPYRKAKELP